MSKRFGPTALPPEAVATHRATRAWHVLHPHAGDVQSVTMLTQKKKSAVYRLGLAGWIHSTVIAKSCSRRYAIEARIYSDVLPGAGLPTLELYGSMSGFDENRLWMFMEDLGDEHFSPTASGDRAVFTDWLAALHRWDVTRAGATELPDCGPANYLAQLQSARAVLHNNRNHPWLSDRLRHSVDRIFDLLDRIEASWPRVVSSCDRAPRTLVHGDLVGKNIRLRAVDGRRELVALDWETGGIGVPGIDFKLFDGNLQHYAAKMQPLWPGVSLAQLTQLADIGGVFRSLDVLKWDSCDLAYPWCSETVFESFVGRLAAAARTVESAGA